VLVAGDTVEQTMRFSGLSQRVALAMIGLAVTLWIPCIAAIENPASRRRGMGYLAAFHAILLLGIAIRGSHQLVHNHFGFVFVVGLMAATLAFMYTWAMANGDPRPGWNRIIDVFRRGVRPPSRQPTSDYEDRVRAAAAQEERNRLARELHDSIKQQVFAIHTAAATAEARLGTDASGAAEAIAQVRESARDAMLEMDAMLDQMRSGPLTNAGLVDALHKQAEALRLRTGADVTVTVDALPPEHELPPVFRQALVRAAQESLNNVAKHARASHVTLSLANVGGELVLTVADDGAGYDRDAPTHGSGLGGMRARAEECDGDFSVVSAPGKGTTVRFAVPVISVPTVELGRMALWAVAGIVLLLLLSIKIGHVALVALPLPVLEFIRLALAWRRARRLAKARA
jgi:signal transduction histidine kinase